MDEGDVRDRAVQALIAAAKRNLRRREFGITYSMAAAGLCFVAGMVSPLRSLSALLMSCAAVGFISAALMVRGRNESAERLARLVSDR